MTQVAIREALVGAVSPIFSTQYPLVPIVFDNAAFNRNSPPPLWVEYEIKFADGRQVGMAVSPKTRIHGFLYVTIWAREGTGTKTSLALLDWFSERLAYQSFSGVHLQAAEPQPDKGPVGWHLEQLKLYFYSNPA